MNTIFVVDFETNDGFDAADNKVIEMGYCLVKGAGEAWTVAESWAAKLLGAPFIAPGARAVHHISPADIAGKEPFDPDVDLWPVVGASGALVVAAHYVDFESKLWGKPNVPVLCTYKAALRVWPEAPSHSNGALRYWLEDQGLINPRPELTQPAHRASADAYVTGCVLTALLVHATAREMCAWTREPALLPRCPIGDPWRGKPWAEVETGFLTWMVNKPVEPDYVWNARRELQRRMDHAN